MAYQVSHEAQRIFISTPMRNYAATWQHWCLHHGRNCGWAPCVEHVVFVPVYRSAHRHALFFGVRMRNDAKLYHHADHSPSCILTHLVTYGHDATTLWTPPHLPCATMIMSGRTTMCWWWW